MSLWRQCKLIVKVVVNASFGILFPIAMFNKDSASHLPP